MIKMCPNCGKENKTTNIKCEFCGKNFIVEEAKDYTTNLSAATITSSNNTSNVSLKKTGCVINMILFFSLGLFILGGVLFTAIGLYSYISEHNQTRNYDSTTATLRDYENCYYDDGDEFCEAVYEYQVHGITYTVSPAQLSSEGGFKTTATVYYNPNNPSEAIMYANWGTLTIVGIIILIAVAVIFISINIKLFKSNIKTNNINKE